MDTSELLAQVREWFRGVGSTLAYIWRTRKVLVISVFVLLSAGLVVWARFGFQVQYSRFLASEIDEGCSSDFPKRSSKTNAFFADIIPIGTIDEDETTACENALGQVNIFPTEFPQCLVWGYNQNRYEEFTESRANDPDDPSIIGDPISTPFAERYLVAEGIVHYNNCLWDVSLKAAYPGSYRSALDVAQGESFNTSSDDLDIPADASFGTEPTDLQMLSFPSCTRTANGSDCSHIGFEIELDTFAADCGRVAAEIAFEHQTPEGLRYSWFNYRDEEIKPGVPMQPPPRTFTPENDTSSNGSGGSQQVIQGVADYGTAALRDHLFAVVQREPGQKLSDMDPVREGMHREGKLVNVWSYARSCTGAPGEKRPETRADTSQIPGVTCSIAEGPTACAGNDVVQTYVDDGVLSACPQIVLTTCANGCGVNAEGNGVCRNADGTIPSTDGTGGTGGTGSLGPVGGGNTGTASCEEIAFCPAGTVGLGAARNGAEFVDDSNLGWFDFTGGSLTLVCGPGLGGRAGTVYVGPPPPRQCPDGRTIPNSGDYRTLRATNISNYCFGDPQAAFDIGFLNPTHVIDCSQHEPGYSETYDLPQGEWFFGAIGPGTATAAACIPGSSGGFSGGQTCDGDGSSCPDPSGTPRAANVSVTCGDTANTISWQNPQSLGAVVNSVQRSVNGGTNEFIFAEGGCYTSFGISTFTDSDVSPGNTYTYRVKTGANVASNAVTCSPGGTVPTQTPVSTPIPTATASPTPTPVVSETPRPDSDGDTDDDGIPDEEECPTAAQGFCRDSDGDTIPDFRDPGIGAAGQTPTGPGEATLLAFLLSGLTAFLYVSYTHTSLFRRREVDDIGQDRDRMDFRA